MTPAQIDALLTVPAWQRTVLTALATYGGFVGDTDSSPGWLFSVEAEAGNQCTRPAAALGGPVRDPWWAFAGPSNG